MPVVVLLGAGVCYKDWWGLMAGFDSLRLPGSSVYCYRQTSTLTPLNQNLISFMSEAVR